MGNVNFVSGTVLDPLMNRNRAAALSDVSCPERIKILGQLTAAVSHEIAQPLLAALNYLTVAAARCREDSSLDPVLRETVLNAASQVDRAVQIARQVRRFAVTGGPSTEVFDLNALLGESLQQIQHVCAKSPVYVQFDPYSGALQVLADRVLVQQVVLNLVRNACEAMEDLPAAQRVLHVSTSMHDRDHARVTVSDCGPGLPKESPLMSTPFLSSKQEGLGLGLWLSRTIIESNNGQLWAEDNPNGGAILSLTLPLADGANQWKS